MPLTRRQRTELAATDLGLHLVESGRKQPPKRRHVGVDPHRPVGHLGSGGAGQRTKPGLGGDELFGLRGQLGEIGAQARIVDRGVGEGLRARRDVATLRASSQSTVGATWGRELADCCFLG